MKILVTGGAGFIGRHLVRFLLEKGNSVTIYDNFAKSSEEKIQPLQKNGASLVRGDVTEYDSLKKALSNGFDAVVHLAAKTGVIDSIKYPEETHHVNVTGTLRVLRACITQKIKNVVIASSGAVYGNSKSLPLSEDLHTIPVKRPDGQYEIKLCSSCSHRHPMKKLKE